MSSAPWYQWDGQSLVLNLHIQPRATKNEIVGPHGERLKIRLTAPPVDGKANSCLLEFLADYCGVARSAVTLLAGTTGRAKRVAIDRPKRLPTGVESANTRK